MGKNRDHIEERAQERTSQLEQINRELANTNEALLAEIANCKKAEATLIETDQKLRNIIEHSTNLFYMHGTDHVFTYTSPQSRHFFDCEPEEAMGRWTELITDNPLNRAAIEATQRAIDTGERQPSYMVECIGRKGRIVWVEVNESPIVVEGRTVAIVGSLTDITERKRTEEALRESQRALSTLMSNLPGMAYRCLNDKDWTMEFVSEGCFELTGYQQAGLVQKGNISYARLIHPDDRESVWNGVQAALREKRPFELVYRICTAAGVEKWVWERGRGIFGPDGELLALEGFITDITERKMMEAELEHFASFPRLDPTPIIEMDADGKVTFCNRAAEMILGKAACLDSSNPLIPKDLTEIIRDLHQKTVSQLTRKVEMGDLVFDEMIYLAPQFNSVRIFAMDVTERRRLEEERNRLAAIVENSDDAIIAKTLDGIIVDWNKGAEKLYGYTASEMKGRHISTLLPADRVDEVPQILERIERGENAEHIETIRVAKDGRPIPVSLAISPIKDTSGKITGTSTIAHDITERKRAEEALRESEQRFASFMLHMPAAAWMKDMQGRFVYANAETERAFATPLTGLLGKTDWDFFPPEMARQFAENDCRVLSEGGSLETIEVLRQADGTEHYSLVSKFAVAGPDGKPAHIAGVAIDITGHKLAENEIKRLNSDLAARAAELEAANREMEAFNYTVAHDLRKPLTIVNGYCQALKELCGEQLDVDCKEYLEEAYDGTMRMNQLIDALLNFSRLSHVELRRETVDLSVMAKAVAAELRLAEPERRVTFLIADGISTDGDENLLRVVLVNLIGNAWKYTGTRDEGIIEFGATEVDGKPAWFVRDNGAGFDMADADKLFTPFQRLPGAEEFGGHGIGLATVERIISRHGGKIWAEGEQGKGATFYFTLPL